MFTQPLSTAVRNRESRNAVNSAVRRASRLAGARATGRSWRHVVTGEFAQRRGGKRGHSFPDGLGKTKPVDGFRIGHALPCLTRSGGGLSFAGRTDNGLSRDGLLGMLGVRGRRQHRSSLVSPSTNRALRAFHRDRPHRDDPDRTRIRPGRKDTGHIPAATVGPPS